MTIDHVIDVHGRDGDQQNHDCIRGQVRIQVADPAKARSIEAIYQQADQDAFQVLANRERTK